MKNHIQIILILFAFVLNSCESESLSGMVQYKVISSPSGFDITYENESGNTEQVEITSDEWTKEFLAMPGDFVYLSAQADNEDAEIEVEILFKGNLIESSKSSGDFVIATASGSLPD